VASGSWLSYVNYLSFYISYEVTVHSTRFWTFSISNRCFANVVIYTAATMINSSVQAKT